MAQTFNTSISFIQSTSRKDRRKGVGSLSVSAVAGGGVGSAADSATQAWVRDNFVDKTTEQEISALKIFSQGIKIGDVSLFKHPDGYVYLDETLVLKGGVVMYGNGSGAEVPSIFDSLPIDGVTIKRDGNGALYVDETALSISGGGGVADSVYWNNVIGKPSWIGSTKPSYTYSEISGTPDLSVYAKLTDIPSLSGYATQTWVEGKGYLLATTASSTYQPKITSSNKLAYSLISDTPDLSGYATQSWVGDNYLSKSGGTVNGNLKINSVGTQSYITYAKNHTALGYLGFDGKNNPVYIPSEANVIYSLLHTNNFSEYALPKMGGTVTGDLTLSTATTGASPKLIFERYGSNNTFIDWAIYTASGALIFTNNVSGSHETKFFVNENGAISTNNSVIANSFIGNLTGNADSATKLATARTIWGNVFDGSAPISGNIMGKVPEWYIISGEQNIIRIATAGTIITPYDKESGWVAMRTGDETATNGSKEIRLLSSGNVAIGGATADAKLHVHGNGIFTDNLTVQSITVGGVTLRKVDNHLYLDSSLVLSGGVTMYGDDGVTVKPIWESIPFDRTTIDWIDGKWTVVGGVGSGGISEEFLNVKLQGYQPLLSTTNKLPYSLISGTPDLSVYAKTTDIPSLAGYATQTWVEGKGYLLATTASSTYQSKITSSNKLAYSLISDTPDLSVYALKTAIPTKLSQLTDDVVSGKYLPSSGGTVDGNLKINSVGTQSYITYAKNHTALGYLGFDGKNNPVYIPSEANVIYSLLHTNNFSEYALPKMGGTVTGDTTFSSKVVIGTIPVYQSADGTLFVDANVVFRGGVAMYGNSTTTINEE